MTTTDVILRVEDYCVLCRRALNFSQDNSYDKDNDDRLDSNKWEANVIAFYDGGGDGDDGTRLHVFAQPNLSAA